MKPLLLYLLILTLLLTFTYQKDTYPTQTGNKCLGDPFKKWCRPTNNEDGGIGGDLNDPNSACQQGEANVCSNQKQFTFSSAKLLCPSGIKACQAHVEKVINAKEQKVAYQVHMDQNDLCWFKVQSLKQYTKTLNVEICKRV